MKLLRWTLAGASFYVIYKYAIGNKARGEDVFVSPSDGEDQMPPAPATPKPRRAKPRKPKSTPGG